MILASEWLFLRPWWFLILPFGCYFIYRLREGVTQSSAWKNVIQADFLEHLTTVQTERGKSLLPWFYMFVWCLTIIGMAGPSIDRQTDEHFVTIQGRVIVWDLSVSMNTADIKPSRLDQSRFKIRDILSIPGDMQYGLVVAGGDGFVVTPITDDRKTVLNMLPAISTSIMPVQGNRIDKGLELADELLKGAGITHGEIILITDGINEQAKTLINKLATQNVRVLILAIGTLDGAPIVDQNGGFVKDTAGNIVISGVDFASLQHMAKNAGGLFSRHSADSSDIQSLGIDQTSLTINASREQGRVVQRIDLGFWFLLPGLFALLLGFRRGYAFLLLPVLMPFSDNSFAFEWQDLWQTPDQQAAHAFDQNDYTSALESGSEEWRGASQYRSNDYKAAIESWRSGSGSKSAYNLGNALARDGQLQEAIDAYAQIDQGDSVYEDAQYNKQLVESLLAQQKQQEQQNQQSDNQQNNQDQQQSEENSQSENSESSDDSGSQEQDEEENNTQESQSKDESTQQNASEQQESTDSESAEGEENDNQNDEENKQENVLSEPAELTQEQAEENEALQQWLRQIPDDPQGLLRRKFLYQYQQRQNNE